jgi:uncharacterized protein (UPF0332 family)
MDTNSIRIKERIAEESYDNFQRNYRNKRLREASLDLSKTIKYLVQALALFKDKELNTHQEIMNFLNELLKDGEIIKEEMNTAKTIYINGLRGTMDERMFDIYIERAEKLINKLKAIIKGNLINI